MLNAIKIDPKGSCAISLNGEVLAKVSRFFSRDDVELSCLYTSDILSACKVIQLDDDFRSAEEVKRRINILVNEINDNVKKINKDTNKGMFVFDFCDSNFDIQIMINCAKNDSLIN